MSRVIGFHLIGCTYGFWLPNDQRGSGSDFVRAPNLTKFGPPTKVSTRRSVAHKPFDFQIRKLAKESLKYPPVVFNLAQIRAISRGITREIETFRAVTIHAFAQLENHFHLVCGPCRYDIRRFEGRLKGAATKQLIEERIHPLAKFADHDGDIPSPWSVNPWVVYLFTGDDVIRSVKYAHDNLARARLPRQDYRFIVPYGGRTAAPTPGQRRTPDPADRR
jgi:REP element-mobilizing transposase RayT